MLKRHTDSSLALFSRASMASFGWGAVNAGTPAFTHKAPNRISGLSIRTNIAQKLPQMYSSDATLIQASKHNVSPQCPNASTSAESIHDRWLLLPWRCLPFHQQSSQVYSLVSHTIIQSFWLYKTPQNNLTSVCSCWKTWTYYNPNCFRSPHSPKNKLKFWHIWPCRQSVLVVLEKYKETARNIPFQCCNSSGTLGVLINSRYIKAENIPSSSMWSYPSEATPQTTGDLTCTQQAELHQP